MFHSLTKILASLAVVTTSFGYAELGSGPLVPSKLTSSDTCNGSENGGFSALDIDADGKVNLFTDGVLLSAMMAGSLNTIPTGASKTTKALFASKSGVRVEYERYYRNTLLNLGLDVDGDGKVSADTDGKMIVLSLALSEGASAADIQKAAARGFRANFAQLEKLKSLKFVCRGGSAGFLDSAYSLQPTANYFVNWGGQGLVWVYSRSLKNWLYITRAGAVYEHIPKTNPAKGNLIQKAGAIDSYYLAHPEILVDLYK